MKSDLRLRFGGWFGNLAISFYAASILRRRSRRVAASTARRAGTPPLARKSAIGLTWPLALSAKDGASIRHSASRRSHEVAVVCAGEPPQPPSLSRRVASLLEPPSTMSTLGGVYSNTATAALRRSRDSVDLLVTRPRVAGKSRAVGQLLPAADKG